MSISEGVRSYYRNFGLRGVLAVAANRLVGAPKELMARPAGIRNPIHVRLRTSDVLVYASILLEEQYAFDLPFVPKIIVDAGANIGTASIYFAHRYPEAKIFAVEAEASNFAVLVKNVEPYPAIVPIHAALWNHDGEISISEPSFSPGAWGFVTHEGSGSKVRSMTMATLMREMRISSIDLLKVDIEGAEKEMFQVCDWMQNVRSLMIELHDQIKPGCSEAVRTATRGFQSVQRGETTFYVRETTSKPVMSEPGEARG